MAEDTRRATPTEEDDEFRELFDDETSAYEEDDMRENRTRRPRGRRKFTPILVILLVISIFCNICFVVRDFKNSKVENQPATNQTEDQQNNQGTITQQPSDKSNTNQPTNATDGKELSDEELEAMYEWWMSVIAGEAGSGIEQEPVAPSRPPVSDQVPTEEEANQTPQAPVVCDPPQVVVIENDYKDRVRKASSKVTSDATTSLLETKLELNTHGKITVNMYGEVNKAYAVVGTADYTEVQLTNAAEYNYFTYQVPEKEQVLFKLEMTDGTLYYLSVYDS